MSSLFKNKHIKIILSVIWGLGLASLFKKVCKGRKCIEYKAPSPDYIKNNIFSFNDKCYKYKPKLINCKSN